MFLVELVMQGVRGIRNVARLRFQGGFNMVIAGNEAGKTSAVDAMLRLLYPKAQPDVMEQLMSRHTPDASRAALVIHADEGPYYRVLQDFSKRAVNLSKYNAATKDFSLINKDWDSTAEFLSTLTAGISEEEYNRLYVLRRGSYDGGGKASRVAATQIPDHGRFFQAQTASKKNSPSDPRLSRLDELHDALRRSEEAADADYVYQSAKLKLEETGKKLEKMEESNRRIADLESNLETLAGCDKLPQNLAELLDDQERRQGQHLAKAEELNQDIEDLKSRAENIPPANLVKNKFFIAGAVVGIVSVVAGLFILNQEQSHYFPLGVLLALVLIALAWYQGSRKSTERNAILKEAEDLEAELRSLERSFAQASAQIESCMKATGSATAAELKEKAGNYKYFLSLRADLEDQRKLMLGSTETAALLAEYEKQQQQAAELERAAAALAHNAVDSYSLRQDIERLEAELGTGVTLHEDSPTPESSFSAPVLQASGPSGVFFADLEAASSISGIEIDTLVPAVAAAAQRNLSSITGGKYVRIDVGQEGDPVVHADDDSRVNLSELSHGTRELLHFCLRTGLIEALAGKLRMPFILDDALAGFDPGRQQASCQVLRTLGAKTQVILFTSNPALRAAGDAAAELK